MKKLKYDALGVGRRAGATFESLKADLGLGVEDSGAVPVSLRLPEEVDAVKLEDQ